MAPGQGLGRGAAAEHGHHAEHAEPAPAPGHDEDHEDVGRGRDVADAHETYPQQAAASLRPAKSRHVPLIVSRRWRPSCYRVRSISRR